MGWDDRVNLRGEGGKKGGKLLCVCCRLTLTVSAVLFSQLLLTGSGSLHFLRLLKTTTGGDGGHFKRPTDCGYKLNKVVSSRRREKEKREVSQPATATIIVCEYTKLPNIRWPTGDRAHQPLTFHFNIYFFNTKPFGRLLLLLLQLLLSSYRQRDPTFHLLIRPSSSSSSAWLTFRFLFIFFKKKCFLFPSSIYFG